MSADLCWTTVPCRPTTKPDNRALDPTAQGFTVCAGLASVRTRRDHSAAWPIRPAPIPPPDRDRSRARVTQRWRCQLPRRRRRPSLVRLGIEMTRRRWEARPDQALPEAKRLRIEDERQGREDHTSFGSWRRLRHLERDAVRADSLRTPNPDQADGSSTAATTTSRADVLAMKTIWLVSIAALCVAAFLAAPTGIPDRRR